MGKNQLLGKLHEYTARGKKKLCPRSDNNGGPIRPGLGKRSFLKSTHEVKKTLVENEVEVQH